MSCKTEVTDINDIEYSVTQWPAEKAMLMKFKIIKVVGPVFATLAEYEGNEEQAVSSAISKLFENASPEELVALIKECIVLNVARDGKKITSEKYTEVFSGDGLMEVYKVFLFVLRVNFGGFMKGQLGSTLLAKVKENL